MTALLAGLFAALALFNIAATMRAVLDDSVRGAIFASLAFGAVVCAAAVAGGAR